VQYGAPVVATGASRRASILAMSDGRRDLPTTMAKALSHPLRQRLLIAYNQRPSSPSEAAERLGEPLGNVAYHTKRLVEHGVLELIGTSPGRGGVKHTYRATVRYELEDDTWIELPVSLRGSLAGRAISEIGCDVAAGAAAGGFGDDDVHVSRVNLALDDRGWGELSRLLRELVAHADRIVEESAARGPATGRSVLATMHFRTGERA
jgi:DNA-binding transcriptional ArsR family regulator